MRRLKAKALAWPTRPSPRANSRLVGGYKRRSVSVTPTDSFFVSERAGGLRQTLMRGVMLPATCLDLVPLFLLLLFLSHASMGYDPTSGDGVSII
jgi:hypothetical protein